MSGGVCRSYTSSRRRPSEIGRLPGLTLPWTFTLAQFAVGVCGIAACVVMLWSGLSVLVLPLPVAATLWLGRAVRRTSIDSRHLAAGLAGRLRFRAGRSARRRLADRTADAVAANAVVGSDYSVWVVLAATPAHYGMLADPDAQRAALGATERLVSSISAKRWKLMSTLETVASSEVARRMAATSPAASWAEEIAAEQRRLETMTLTERRFWLWLDIGDVSAPAGWAGAVMRLRRLAGWTAPARAAWLDRGAAEAATEAAVSRASSALGLRGATSGEIKALLERVATGVCSVPAPEPEGDYRHLEPAAVTGATQVGTPGRSDGASVWRRGDAAWGEPSARMALAETAAGGDAVAHVTAMVAQLPDAWHVPGGGELLWRLDSRADPWEWVIDATTVPHSVAVAKTRNQASQLRSQYDQYAGAASGTPPDLDLAVAQVETQRLALAERSDSDEYVVSVALCTSVHATAGLDAAEVLAGRLQRLQGLASALGITVAAPCGDQVSARRMWLPLRAARCPAVRDYRQYLLADGVAGLGPCLHARLGDPQGAVLGLVDEHGTLTPVLFDPTLGPRAGSVGGSPRSPSIGIAGALGRGKSVFSKRVLWTTLAAGGAVVVVDRSEMGEYAAVARAICEVAPGITVEVIDVTDPAGWSIDPMRTGLGTTAAADTAVRLLCFTAGLDPRSPVAAEVARAAAANPGAPLSDVVSQAASTGVDGAEWRALTSLVEVLGSDPIGGSLFDADRLPANLGADLVVLHAPGLALSAAPETPADVAATAVVLGTMLVARALIFADPARFAALLLDEAWALLPDNRARTVVVEALRDGRKHNAGVWLATQSPQDFAVSPELAQLLGNVALFGVTTEEAAHAAAQIAGVDPALASPTLMALPTGVMLWRDVYGRTGLVDVLLPADRRAAVAVETTPDSSPQLETVPV